MSQGCLARWSFSYYYLLCVVVVRCCSALRFGEGNLDREVRDELFMFQLPLSADFSPAIATTTPVSVSAAGAGGHGAGGVGNVPCLAEGKKGKESPFEKAVQVAAEAAGNASSAQGKASSSSGTASSSSVTTTAAAPKNAPAASTTTSAAAEPTANGAPAPAGTNATGRPLIPIPPKAPAAGTALPATTAVEEALNKGAAGASGSPDASPNVSTTELAALDAAEAASQKRREAIQKASDELTLKIQELNAAKEIVKEWKKEEDAAAKVQKQAEKDAASEDKAEARAEMLGVKAYNNEAAATKMATKSDQISDEAMFEAEKRQVREDAAKQVLSSEPSGCAKDVVKALAAKEQSEKEVAQATSVSAGQDSKRAESIKEVSRNAFQAAAAASDYKKAVSAGMQKIAASKSVEGAADAAGKQNAMATVAKKEAEVQTAMHEAFKTLDANGDGKIDFAEFSEREQHDANQ